MNTLKLKDKGPKGAAMALKKHIINTFGLQEANVTVWSPKEALDYTETEAWVVSWEEGPFEWASSILGGCGYNDFEQGLYSGSGQAVDTDGAKCSLECLNSFQIGFYKD